MKFKDGELGADFTHLPPLIDDDGGHGMILFDGEKLWLTYHTPNKQGEEHPAFREFFDQGNSFSIKR